MNQHIQQSDIVAVAHGSLIHLVPLTNRAHDFIDGDIDVRGWQRDNDALVLSAPMASLIVEVAQNLGLRVATD